MKQFFKTDPWNIIVEDFDPSQVEACESLFSLGNGKMGQRACFEEQYSGSSFKGNYFAGIFYPDKTRVGWWKIGYPEYYGKMINSLNWVGIDIFVDNESLDLFHCKVNNFRQVLNMKEGSLRRHFRAQLASGKIVEVETLRFISIADTQMAAIHYGVTPINFSGNITFAPYLNGDVSNRDSNYDEKFWDEVKKGQMSEYSFLQIKTNKLDFEVCSAMESQFFRSGNPTYATPQSEFRDKYLAARYTFNVLQNEQLSIVKYIANITSLEAESAELSLNVSKKVSAMTERGFVLLFEDHKNAWEKIWEQSDVIIENDDLAQQGIRFAIFHLSQTYTGDDARLNVGPKGFTGEKYGGGTYWDTEAYCLPFFLCTKSWNVSRNLLLYRYKHLQKAIENAEKLGFSNGAAFYPMVTFNGEESHSEWEITFEEIHRNGAIVYGIYNYLRHTGDDAYIAHYGIEVLIAISRFWVQRCNFSSAKNKYVILGVTGPNEYENNVNNNWYTNYIASWSLSFTLQQLDSMRLRFPEELKIVLEKTCFDMEFELQQLQDIVENIFLPKMEGSNIVMQQEGFFDKAQQTVDDIPEGQRPLNQHWSWDRILRSVFIKQADVLQGMYFFMDHFSINEIKDNFNFYEPMTVHESSLSACVHSVLAAHIGNKDKAYELFLRSARIDLDDYNSEIHEGLHVTSMAGAWTAVVEGFAGKRIMDGKLSFAPCIPNFWKAYSFRILFHNHVLEVAANQHSVKILNQYEMPLEILLYGQSLQIKANGWIEEPLQRK